MRVEPHENLMVLSIRHERFDVERLHPTVHHEHAGHDAPMHQIQRTDRWEPSRAGRVVDQTQRPEPADCRSSQCGGETSLGVYPSDDAYPATIPMPEVDVVTVPADIASPSEPGALQGYIYGQAVPTSGNLLDVLA